MSIFSSDKSTAESGHINVIAEVKAKPGKEEEVRLLFSALVEPSRAEEGCKAYHLLEAKHAPGTLFTYEEWTSETMLDQHLAGAKSKLDAAKSLVHGEMKITVLNHLI